MLQNQKVRCKCIKRVDEKMECKKCGNQSVKNGKSKIGIQRYRCKSCGISFQSSYNYTSFMVSDDQVVLLTKEGCGIRSTARILSISQAAARFSAASP